MGKPRIYGMQSSYIPNAKADMRHKPHIYQRGQVIAGSDTARQTARAKRRMKERNGK